MEASEVLDIIKKHIGRASETALADLKLIPDHDHVSTQKVIDRVDTINAFVTGVMKDINIRKACTPLSHY